MPLPDADRHAREQIEHHRQQMRAWKKARAQRLAAERAAGKPVDAIAQEIGVSPATVYEVLRSGPDLPVTGKRRGRPRKPRD